MPATVTLNAAGLFTNPNPVGTEVPDGALSRAMNVVIDRPGVATSRRGMAAKAYQLGSGADGLSSFFYDNKLFVHTDANRLQRDTGSTFVNVLDSTGAAATVEGPVMGGRVHATTSQGKLYVTTEAGVLEMDGSTAALKVPGVPRALDIREGNIRFGADMGGTGFLPPGAVVGYRAVWGFNDSRGVPVLGAPSGRFILKNPTHPAKISRTGGVTTVSISPANFVIVPVPGDIIGVSPVNANNPEPVVKTVTATNSFTNASYSEALPDLVLTDGYTFDYRMRPTYIHVPIPSGVGVGHFLQVHRTASIVSPFDDPGDNMAQVAEVVLTQAHVTAGYVEILDSVPDVLRSPPLYTSAFQQGISQSNMRPPLARDLVVFRDSVFLANTIGAHGLTIRFLGMPENGDVLTIAGLAYTGTTSSSPPNGQFLITNFDGVTVSENVRLTSMNLINAINKDTRNPSVIAYYVSGDGDAPGMIQLVAKTFSSTPFTVQASANGTRYQPELVSAISSVRDVRPNRLHYSKTGLPYAFPLGNTIPVGSEDSEILRIVALRDSLFAFKRGTGEGKGVWRITGSGPGYFTAVSFNPSIDLIAPETLAVVDNQIFGLSNQGVFSISESGVEIVDVAIEDQIRKIIVQAAAPLEDVAHGVAYESVTEKKYMLWLPTAAGHTHPQIAFVYNLNTDTWTQRDEFATCGVTGGTGSLLNLCVGSTVQVERRTNTPQDFIGPYSVAAGEAQAPSPNGFFGDDVSGLLPGQAIWAESAGPEYAQRILEVNYTTGEVTLTGGELISQGLPEIFYMEEGIPLDVEWTVNHAGQPASQKQFFDTAILFEEAHEGVWEFDFTADLDPTPSHAQGWAESTQWVRTEVPWDVQRTTRLGVRVQHRAAVEPVNIVGIRSNMNIYTGTLSR